MNLIERLLSAKTNMPRTMEEAADEIERLQARVRELESQPTTNEVPTTTDIGSKGDG